MRGCNVNIYFSEETYNKIKPLIQQRKISFFVNQAVEKELESQQKEQKEQLRERLIEAYKREAKNKEVQEEMAIWEGVAGDSISDE